MIIDVYDEDPAEAVSVTVEELQGFRSASRGNAEIEVRTCRNVGGDSWPFECSECGARTSEFDRIHPPRAFVEELEGELLAAIGAGGGRIVSPHSSVPKFCPWCGAKVVEK